MKGYGWPKFALAPRLIDVLPRTTPAVSARLCHCSRVITLLGDSCLDEIQYAENVGNLMTVSQFLQIWTFGHPMKVCVHF